MFMSDFNKAAINRKVDEFSMYCRDEGLDRQMLLSQLSGGNGSAEKKRKLTAFPWKMLKRSVMVLR